MKTHSYILIAMLFLLHSCVEEEHPFSLPYAPVYFEIDLNGVDSDLHDLSYKTFKVGRTIRERVGYGGLLVFRNHEGTVIAYDLSCPYEKARDVRVKPNNQWKAECPECGSLFDMLTGIGNPETGPSELPLQKYNVIPDSRQKGRFLIKN